MAELSFFEGLFRSVCCTVPIIRNSVWTAKAKSRVQRERGVCVCVLCACVCEGVLKLGLNMWKEEDG